MFSFWSRSAAAPANGETDEIHEKHESTGSASPPPPSTVTEQTPALPKPKKPRQRTKKRAPATENALNASEEAKVANGTKAGTASLDELKELIANVPPKTLHLFLMGRLDVQKPGRTKKRPNANVFPTLQNDFPVLSAFFNGLEPPPKRHCLRCHSDYVDIENGPRACVKEHDDDSAVVRNSTQGIHHTFWGCCGQTVDGDGDQGPPTGWCYEGPHTADKEEARYRQDETPDDDKLGDCAKLRCGQAPRKRKRASSIDSDSADDTPVNALEPRQRHARRKSEVQGRSKSRLRDLPSDADEDIIMSDVTVENPKKTTARRTKKLEATEDKKEATPAGEENRGRKSTGGRMSRKKAEEATSEGVGAMKEIVEKTEEAKKPNGKRGTKKRKTEG